MMVTRGRIIIIVYLTVIAIGGISATLYQNHLMGNEIIGGETITKLSVVRDVDVSKMEIFDVMANITNYPKVLPDNFISIKILNQTINNSSKIEFAEDKVSQAGVMTTLIVKHEIIPYHSHMVKILNGDANGTIITATFDDLGTYARVTTNTELHLHGILAPFGFLSKSNLEHAMNTVIINFEKYAKNHHKQEKYLD